jgi:spore coat polysaccharide biosynthesis protein SpsF
MDNMNQLKKKNSSKIGIFITARLKSTRLPFKVIKPIMGRPMVEWMIDRLKRCNIQSLIMMTSTNPQDDPLVEIAKNNSIDCFRGSEDDVLLRMKDCATQFHIDLIICVTADNPFVEPLYIQKMVDKYYETQYDYCETRGLPVGCFAYAVTRTALEKVFEIKDSSDTEIWGPYFKESGVFKCEVIAVTEPEIHRPQYRLTVDHPEDFILVSKIFEILGENGKYFDIFDICKLLDENKDLVDINSHIIQRTAPPTKIKRNIE